MTTRLYPRLIRSKAVSLFNALDERTEWAAEHRSVTYAPTGPDRVSPKELKALRASVVEVAARHGFPATGDRAARQAFDRDVAGVLIRESMLFPAEAAVGDVWSFIALVLLPDVALWRADTPNIEVFRGIDLTRHVFARLWWRAYLLEGHQRNAADLERDLSVFGSADFDQIQTRRKAFGGSPRFFRTFVGLWGDLRQDGRLAALAGAGLAERALLRSVLMRVLRVGAFIEYEVLDPEQLREHILGLIRDAVEAFGADPDILADTPSSGGAAFDQVPIDDLMQSAVGVIRSRGSVADDTLIDTFEEATGIAVPPKRQRMLRRLLRAAEARSGVKRLDGTWTAPAGGDVPPITARSMSELSARAVELGPWADGTDDALLAEAFHAVSGVTRWLTQVAIEEATAQAGGRR